MCVAEFETVTNTRNFIVLHRTKPVQTNIRKRLQAALEKNPNFLKGYLSDVSQQLDIALESHGIAKVSGRVLQAHEVYTKYHKKLCIL